MEDPYVWHVVFDPASGAIFQVGRERRSSLCLKTAGSVLEIPPPENTAVARTHYVRDGALTPRKPLSGLQPEYTLDVKDEPLRLALPAGSTVERDGQAYHDQTMFEFEPETPGRYFILIIPPARFLDAELVINVK